MNDFYVKVHRFYQDDTMVERYGWFISKVYAIRKNKFLVYDNGENDESCKDFSKIVHRPVGFTWVDFTETIRVPDSFMSYELSVELFDEKGDEQNAK